MSVEKNAEFNIVSVGDCIVDHLYYVNEPGEIDLERALLKNPDEARLEVSFGGKGANSIIAASRLGSKCALISKIGRDELGSSYIEHLAKENINTSHVSVTGKADTSIARIFVGPDGSILKQKRVPGATFELDELDIENAESLISQCGILITSLTLQVPVVSKALAVGKKNKCMTILNCSPWTMIKNYSNELSLNVDLLVVNQLEAECLVEFKVNGIIDAERACEALLSSEGSYSIGVIITLGQDGCVFGSKKHMTVRHFEARAVKSVDSIGAGDAFLGSLAHFLSRNAKIDSTSLERSIKLASEYASLSVERKGAQTSYLYLHELDDRFK